jgi:hypothetical protein
MGKGGIQRMKRSEHFSGNAPHAPITRTVLAHLAAFVTAGIVLNLGFYLVAIRSIDPDPAGSLREKLASYREHATEFDLVFVGDSRTYCAMHPDIIDGRLGTHSINLARWAHWFPTQYAQFRDLVPLLPEGTVVVWSVGHQNFRPINEQININYPIGVGNVPDYLRQGYPLSRLSDNLLQYNPLLNLAGWLPRLRDKIDSQLDRVVWAEPGGGDSAQQLSPDVLEAIERVESDPLTARWELIKNGDQVTSIAIYKRNGAYSRVELTPDFFRHKQAEGLAEDGSHLSVDPAGVGAAEEYWNQFVAILALFEAHGVQLIVNELEEAPHQYRSEALRDEFRNFMRETVEPEVLRHGFDYVRVDFDSLEDADYFDYNHLNSRGIGTYSTMLIENLRPYLGTN